VTVCSIHDVISVFCQTWCRSEVSYIATVSLSNSISCLLSQQHVCYRPRQYSRSTAVLLCSHRCQNVSWRSKTTSFWPAMLLTFSSELKLNIWPLLRNAWCNIPGHFVDQKLMPLWTFICYQNWWHWMTLNGVIALTLRYFTEFGRFWGSLRSGWRYTDTLCSRNVAERM